MLKRIKEKWIANVSCDIVEMFLKQSHPRIKHSKKPRTGMALKLIITDEFGQRFQVDMVDMQWVPDRDYKYILNMQDHSTR